MILLPVNDVIKGSLSWSVSPITTKMLRLSRSSSRRWRSDWLELSVTYDMPRLRKKMSGNSRMRNLECGMGEFSSTRKWSEKISVLPEFRRIHLLLPCHLRSFWLENVETPYRWSEYLYPVGCSRLMHSFLQAELIADAKDAKEGRQIIFFTALDVMSKEPNDECQNLSRLRTAHNKGKVDSTFRSKSVARHNFEFWYIFSKFTCEMGPRFDNKLFVRLQKNGTFTYEDTGKSRFPCVILCSAVCLFAGWNHHGRSLTWTWSFAHLCSICHVWWGVGGGVVWCQVWRCQYCRVMWSREWFVYVLVSVFFLGCIFVDE